MKSGKLSVGLVFDDSLDSSDGVAQYVKTLGAWLSGQGHDVTYIVGQSTAKSWSGAKVISASVNLRIRWGGNRLSMPVWPNRRLIKRLIAEKNFDLLHIQVPYSPLMSQYLINRAPVKTAVIGSFHVYPANPRAVRGSKLLKAVYRRSLKRFDKMLAVSPAAAEFAQDGFGLKTDISPNVIDLGRFKNSTKKGDGRRIVFLGRLVERKGCLELLKAFSRLAERMSDVELVIGGDGPLRSRLESFVSEHGLDERVSFLGYIDEASKPGLLGGADIACFPSLYGESFGIVLIEAMAAGAGIVLGGDNPGYRTVLDGQPLALIDPKDTAAFAERLELLLLNKSDAAKLHAWQRQTVKQYDINLVGPRLVQIYRQRIAERSKKGNN